MHLAAYRLGPIQECLLFHNTRDARKRKMDACKKYEKFVKRHVVLPSEPATALVFRGKRPICQDLSNRLANLLRSEGPLARSAGSGLRPADAAAVSGSMS
jgi:hypothetical protein